MEREQIPIGEVTIFSFKNIAMSALRALLVPNHHEARPSDSEHFITDEFDRSSWTPVQQRAAEWGDSA